MKLLRHFGKKNSVLFTLITGRFADAERLKRELEGFDCVLKEIKTDTNSLSAVSTNIVLAFPVTDNHEVIEEYYKTMVGNKSKDIPKLLVISDDLIWKNRHDDKNIFNLPVNSHKFEIARNLHYLSMVS